MTNDYVKPRAYEKSVVLGGGRVLFPVENPADICATMHLHNQAIWDHAYRQGVADARSAIQKALGI